MANGTQNEFIWNYLFSYNYVSVFEFGYLIFHYLSMEFRLLGLLKRQFRLLRGQFRLLKPLENGCMNCEYFTKLFLFKISFRDTRIEFLGIFLEQLANN